MVRRASLLAFLAPLARRSRGGRAEARAQAAAKAAESELYHLFCLSLAVQRDLGAQFVDLRESRLEAARGLRAWCRSAGSEPAEVRLALSRTLRLVQDYPFSFTSTHVATEPAPFPELEGNAAQWARDFTVAYPELPWPLERLAEVADGALGRTRPRRPLALPLASMRERLANAQKAAWEVRRLQRAT